MGERVQVPPGGGEAEERIVWVPFHVYRLKGGGLAAMDASLWRLVEPERRALLVKPLEGLRERPGRCRAPLRVEPREQLRDLRSISSPRLPSLARRIIEVAILPFRVRVDPVEGIQSARLAAAILELDPQPTGAVAWLPLPLGSPPPPYGWLAGREPRLRGELALLASACEGDD